MKTLFFLLIPTLFFAQQKDFKGKKTLSIRYDKGVSSTSKINLNKKQFLKKAICLNKYYDFNFNEMQEFLTKKEYEKKFQTEYIKNDNTYSAVYQSSIQKENFPKCYK